ncbi:MAG: hypothetical protein ABR610_11970 [Thermoanaerobaculia bacterium]
MAGGENLFGQAGRHSPWACAGRAGRRESRRARRLPLGFSLARTEAEADLLRETPGFDDLAPVANGSVFFCDGNQFFNRPGPRVVETLEILAEIFHPDRFSFGWEGVAWKRWGGLSCQLSASVRWVGTPNS